MASVAIPYVWNHIHATWGFVPSTIHTASHLCWPFVVCRGSVVLMLKFFSFFPLGGGRKSESLTTFILSWWLRCKAFFHSQNWDGFQLFACIIALHSLHLFSTGTDRQCLFSAQQHSDFPSLWHCEICYSLFGLSRLPQHKITAHIESSCHKSM